MNHDEKIVRIICYILDEFRDNEIDLDGIFRFLRLLNYSNETERILLNALTAAESEREKKELPF